MSGLESVAGMRQRSFAHSAEQQHRPGAFPFILPLGEGPPVAGRGCTPRDWGLGGCGSVQGRTTYGQSADTGGRPSGG